MTKREYKNELILLTDNFNAEKKALLIRCAKSNQAYKIGDILEGEAGVTIEVKSVTCVLSERVRFPFLLYYGNLLTKKLKPRKNSERASISTVIKKIN